MERCLSNLLRLSQRRLDVHEEQRRSSVLQLRSSQRQGSQPYELPQLEIE